MSTYFPKLPDQVPQRGGAFSRQCFQQLYLLQGWKIQGEIPNFPKAVIIAAPHTSNLDAWYGFNAMLGLGLRLTIFGKDSLFRTPLKHLLKWVGVMPVQRDSPHGLTQAIIQRIQTQDKIWIGLAPEGTRKGAAAFRTGFYRIADGAGIPIVIFAFDFNQKTIRCLGSFMPSGDYESDLEHILQRYSGHFSAKKPHNLSQPLQKFFK